MSLCLTLLAAYACLYQSGQQTISSAPTINATLIGAAGAEYTMPIPVDMTLAYTNQALSISNIETTGGTCTFCGVDGAEVGTFTGPGTMSLKDTADVGPPQTIVFAVCT